MLQLGDYVMLTPGNIHDPLYNEIGEIIGVNTGSGLFVIYNVRFGDINRPFCIQADKLIKLTEFDTRYGFNFGDRVRVMDDKKYGPKLNQETGRIVGLASNGESFKVRMDHFTNPYGNEGVYYFKSDQIIKEDIEMLVGDVKDGYYMPSWTNTFHDYIENDIEATRNAYNEILKVRDADISDFIEKVIFNNPATIVIWKDGTKTIVKANGDDPFIQEYGLAMAIAKKVLGNKGHYYETIKKYCVPENIAPKKPKMKKKKKVKKVLATSVDKNGKQKAILK